jgi:outer membrane protein OmpA-like peptidoglycan-associated protein
MSFNLLDSISGLFNHDLVNTAASSLGESEGNIQKALQAAVPSVLTGFLEKAGMADGAQTLLALARQAADSGILGRLGEFFQNGIPGLAGIAGSLLGDKLGNIGDLIAGFSGIKASSASSLLSMVAPAALGKLGSYAFANNLGANEVSTLLASQKESILSAIPQGFNLAGALGLGSLAGIGSKLSGLSAEPAVHASHGAPEKTRKNNWLVPAFWAIGIFVLLLYIFRSCGAEHIPSDAHEDTLKKEHTEILPAQPVRESLKVKLPDGTELDAYKGGIEDNLVAYLNSNEPVSKEKWFDFDDLNFETGSATITAASMKQVQNIAAILKAFPKVKIKIGGYTDNTGDSLSNVKLSQERADAVSANLKESGHGSQLEAAEGYGPTHFVAPNDTDDNKKKNRRISINVREK